MSSGSSEPSMWMWSSAFGRPRAKATRSARSLTGRPSPWLSRTRVCPKRERVPTGAGARRPRRSSEPSGGALGLGQAFLEQRVLHGGARRDALLERLEVRVRGEVELHAL